MTDQTSWRPLRRPTWRAAAAALVGGLATLPAWSQDGGRLLTFGIQGRLEASDNRALSPDPAGPTAVSDANLSFGLSIATRRESFEISGRTALRLVSGPDGGDEGFSDPRFALDYGRQGANSSFGLSGTYVQGAVAFLRPLDVLDPDGDGIIDDVNGDGIVDLDDLEGDGTRRDIGLSTQLSFGEEGPLGLGLTARLGVTDYQGTTDADLTGSVRTRLGASLRLALTPVASARVGLAFARVDPEDEGPRDTRELDLGLTLGRPLGGIDLDLGLANADEGTRVSLGFGRSLELPLGGISGSLGATRRADGELTVIGSFQGSRQLPQSSIGGSLSRRVTTTEDGETVVTQLAAGYDRTLTDRTSLSVDTGWALTDETGSTDAGLSGDVALQLNWSLTPDWSLGTGLRHTLRDPSGEERADSNAVFVTLGRTFATRF